MRRSKVVQDPYCSPGPGVAAAVAQLRLFMFLHPARLLIWLVLPSLTPFTAGWVLLDVDYSQVELRLMAHFSGDEGLCTMLSIPGADPFKAMAARWHGVTQEQV